MKHILLLIIFFISISYSGINSCMAQSLRTDTLLEDGWKFTKGEQENAYKENFNDSKWQSVSIPHDWAISGPFDINNDLQKVAVTQNGETKATLKTGRTGGLPYVGIGWYRKSFTLPKSETENKNVNLLFDGAMSEALVYVNGQKAIFWPNGYNSFYVDITDLIHHDGSTNTLAVRLENKEQSSRWYPGAGLYRNVHLIITDSIHIPVWGTYITTPYVSEKYASVKLEAQVKNIADGQEVKIETNILDKNNKIVSNKSNTQKLNHGQPFIQNFKVNNPKLWTPETPELYYATSKVYCNNILVDEYTTKFGIRDIKVIADKGFYLNGKLRKFKGVCNHHDLGPLGAAINKAALKKQLTLLKDMGCDAIRTAHNMPAPELVELCDEMGFMMMLEPFDEWDRAKCKNGYHRFFEDWAEKDMINMLHHYRNNPSVVMWSIGNEVPTQCSADGYKVAKFLQDICHREDPTRPVTCGMDRISCVLDNGFAAMLDVPGFNYRVHRYEEGYDKLPQNILLGSETCSTVSSRGVYKLPATIKSDATYDDHQSSSYDLEYCSWSNLPDNDFAMAEDFDWTMGQFVWTGFDYLGEPSPYDTDAWPNHSSMFGIIDLASIPKDRYYLYRSQWNTEDNTLHILPHWNWEGKEGDTIPVYVYTNYPSAELIINGKNYGIQSKNNATLQSRYRLMWDNVVYEPGEVKVIAFDEKGESVAEETIFTAGKPHHINLIPDKKVMQADGKDLVYVRVQIMDKDGNICPLDQRLVNFMVTGNGIFKAAANGDPTCLDPFQNPQMHVFNGQLTAIVQSRKTKGEVTFKASAKGLKSGSIDILVE